MKTELVIPSFSGGAICPVENLKRYLKARPIGKGPLFIHFNGKTLIRYQVSLMLKASLRYLNYDEREYNTHSFRIGAATSFAMIGKSDDDIKKMGRWKSDTYLNFIRMHQLNLS